MMMIGARPGRPACARPVQVYLDLEDQEHLERLTSQLATSKSDILRRGLSALERQLSDPEEHPASRIIGLVTGPVEDPPAPYDIAREHDRFLGESEEASWRSSRRRTRCC